MTVTCDSKRRVILPAGKAGDRFDVEFSSDGRIIFTRLETVKRKVTYVRKDGLLLAVTDAPVSWEETRQAMDELP
jgi:hypothetical protein